MKQEDRTSGSTSNTYLTGKGHRMVMVVLVRGGKVTLDTTKCLPILHRAGRIEVGTSSWKPQLLLRKEKVQSNPRKISKEREALRTTETFVEGLREMEGGPANSKAHFANRYRIAHTISLIHLGRRGVGKIIGREGVKNTRPANCYSRKIPRPSGILKPLSKVHLRH